MSDHLEPIVNSRGFKTMPDIPSEYGGEVKVAESSEALHPAIWVWTTCPENANEPTGPLVEAVAHLHIDEARKLAEQLLWLVEHHYQVVSP